MFGDLAESAKQITDAFAQLNQNLTKQIELAQKQNELLADILAKLPEKYT